MHTQCVTHLNTYIHTCMYILKCQTQHGAILLELDYAHVLVYIYSKPAQLHIFLGTLRAPIKFKNNIIMDVHMYVCTSFPGSNHLYKKVINLCSSCCMQQAILLSFILFYFLLHYRRVSVRHQCNNLTYFSHCVLLYVAARYICMYLCLYTTCVLASSLLIFISIENSLLWQRS